MTAEILITAFSIGVGLPLFGAVLRMLFYKPAWEREGIAPCCGRPYSECSVALYG